MKYFIDFEATQFSNEIISIGCVREDGESFYSLINVKRKKMTKFITDLTGITKEDIANAPSADEVFSKFCDWLLEDKTKIEFFCYGNNDITFIKTNLNKATAAKAQMALGLLSLEIVDFSTCVMKHFGLIRPVSLKKVLAYYRGVEDIEQNHNSYEDALFLKEVYNKICSDEEVVECPFPGYDQETQPSIEVIQKMSMTANNFMTEAIDFDVLHTSTKKGGTIINRLKGRDEAIKYVISLMPSLNQQEAQPHNIAARLVKANNQNKTYCGQWWKIVKRGESV